VRELADGVWQVRGLPFNTINAYVIEDVLIDAAARFSGASILRQLRGHTITAHALTHAHPDHQGASKRVCDQLGVPFWVGELDVDAAEDPEVLRAGMGRHPMALVFYTAFHGPGHKVDRRLHDGDEVAGFRVLDVPGHSIGHVAFWRESDRVLICGDVLTNMDQVTALPGLHEPKPFLTVDVAQNRESARRLAPPLVCFGHGAPLRDTRKFVEFIDGLPA
jgi:glyoxylase-like metal-dependent hydrolase (beta-lactamase superfamily II)